MARARRPKTSSEAVAALVARLGDQTPEARWEAARELAVHGDRTAVAALTRVAVGDAASFQREGAFVDTTEWPYLAALAALAAIHARHAPTAEDVARVRAHVEDLACPATRHEPLAAALGAAAREIGEVLGVHPDPAVRLRAENVRDRAERTRKNRALWSTDEAVRLAATRQDAYREGLVADALEHFPEEPSAAVRRAVVDLWLRHRKRMGGVLRSSELFDLLAHDDPDIALAVATHVREVARRSTRWIHDPASLRPARERLVARGAGLDGEAATTIAEVVELFDRALAPLGGVPPAP